MSPCNCSEWPCRLRRAFSWRYGVVGIYRDREASLWRIYPVPFVRITVGRRDA